jgi:hypothetical protein
MSSWYRDLLSQLNESVAEIEHGFMKHTRDIEGLGTYLKQMGVIPANGYLLPMQEFESAIEARNEADYLKAKHGDRAANAVSARRSDFGDAPIFGYYVNLDERGEFYADVRDENDKTIYEIRNEEEEPEGFDDDMEESQEMVDEADVYADGNAGFITLKLTRKEAEIVAEALNHVGREVFDKEGDGRILIDIARKLRSA